MKDKVLKAALTSAAETIAQALHSYTDDQLLCSISILSRDEEDKDVYSIKVDYAKKNQREDIPVLEAEARITYLIDHGCELIRRVEPIGEEGGEDE